MQLVTALGLIMIVISVVCGAWEIIGRALENMITVIVITIFIGSIIIISLGIIGCYIARIYEEIKDRPKYIISSSIKSIKKQEILI